MELTMGFSDVSRGITENGLGRGICVPQNTEHTNAYIHINTHISYHRVGFLVLFCRHIWLSSEEHRSQRPNLGGLCARQEPSPLSDLSGTYNFIRYLNITITDMNPTLILFVFKIEFGAAKPSVANQYFESKILCCIQEASETFVSGTPEATTCKNLRNTTKLPVKHI